MSWHALTHDFRPVRLITEAEGVQGTGWSKWCSTPGHTLVNLIRFILIIIFSPFWVLTPKESYRYPYEKVKKRWSIDVVHAPPAVLSTPYNGGKPGYDTPHSQPKWMVEVEFKNGEATTRQVPWYSDEFADNKYTYSAISYPFESAEPIFFKRNDYLPEPDGPPCGTRKYSLPTRLEISRIVLDEYVECRLRESSDDRLEYVWFDELCLHDVSLPPDDQRIEAQRDDEVGRLADIFSGAAKVIIFCHITDCPHTGLDCPWGKRLFTLAEIYYAKAVEVMTLSQNGNFTLNSRHGRDFKHDMQRKATLGATGKNWHLSAVMEHATQSTAVSWQLAIHYIIVEALRRDLAGGFKSHKFLGRSLNGLLPRRSLLNQFSKDGWSDLNWMLELNQGYYNAAALAAVCSLAEHSLPRESWLGKPIAPKAGNERLEPLVTAFPVPTGLNFLNPRIVELKKYLERDEDALFTVKEMDGLKKFTYTIFALLFIAAFIILGGTFNLGALLVILWIGCAQLALARLVAASMYVKREGWIVIDGSILTPMRPPDAQTTNTSGSLTKTAIDSTPASELKSLPGLTRTSGHRTKFNALSLCKWLRERDGRLGKLQSWGRDQLAPEWEAPEPTKRPTRIAIVVDLQHGIFAKTIVVNKPDEEDRNKLKLPDSLVPLAVHGCGITCMLLDSYKNPLIASAEVAKAVKDFLFYSDPVAQKMGMVNLPPHILTYGELKGSLRVGDNDEYIPATTPRPSLSEIESTA